MQWKRYWFMFNNKKNISSKNVWLKLGKDKKSFLKIIAVLFHSNKSKKLKNDKRNNNLTLKKEK